MFRQYSSQSRIRMYCSVVSMTSSMSCSTSQSSSRNTSNRINDVLLQSPLSAERCCWSLSRYTHVKAMEILHWGRRYKNCSINWQHLTHGEYEENSSTVTALLQDISSIRQTEKQIHTVWRYSFDTRWPWVWLPAVRRKAQPPYSS